MKINLNTSLVSPHLLTDIGEQDIIRSLKTLKQTFTVSRDQIEDYTKDIRLVMSYALVYLPTNIPKFDFLLEQLDDRERTQLLQTSFIDFGCGPGTYTTAFLRQSSGGSHFAVDTSSLMLEQAEAIIEGNFPDRNVSFQKQIPQVNSKATLCFGNAINEMKAEEVSQIIVRVDPEFLIFIEPGTPEAFQKVMTVRTSLKELGYENLYPCPSGIMNCPLLEEKDWCHQVLRGTHEPDVERLCQLAQIDRKAQPFIGHVYKKGEGKRLDYQARFIRFRGESKHAFEWQVCLAGNEHQLMDLEIPKKTLSKSEQKKFKKLSVGLGLDYKVIKELGTKKRRVEITRLSHITE